MEALFDRRTCWKIHERSKAGLLVDARDYYRAFYEAALHARRSILLLGWQFDSDVELVRGADLPEGVQPADVQLLPLLDRLCRERPELEVRILAWSHSLWFALEREVLQKVVFSLGTAERLSFRLDDTVDFGGSHHQKVAVIDGRIAFMGSADLCHDRWDTSEHAAFEPLRLSRSGTVHKPYHEVQAVFVGAVARSFVQLFAERWRHAVGEQVDPAAWIDDAADEEVIDVPVTLAMPRATVALSRTVPRGEGRDRIHEIRELYARAIKSARRSIYIETQYLTSCTVRDALLRRLGDRRRPPLDFVLVLPTKPERLKEELTVAYPQAAVLDQIRSRALANGHALGVYHVVARDEATGAEAWVYVHSKLMIVDDRFFTMGSANLANRSMTVDSEINATWAAEEGDRRLASAIRRVRVRLLSEHVGATSNPRATLRALARDQGLVARLDAMIASGEGRLRPHDFSRSAAPGAIAKATAELACDYVDPPDVPSRTG